MIYIQTHQQLDARLQELSQVSGTIEQLQAKEQELRKEIFGIVENEGLTDGYKNSLATVSYVERKTVKITDEQKLLEDLAKERIVRYYKVIPQQVIPEHAETTPEFVKDVKAGVFKHSAITVETSSNLAVRFNK